MKQIKIVNAYNATNELANKDDLTISGKWAVYKLRKELSSYYEFYVQESRKLFEKYDATLDGTTLHFKTPEEAQEYTEKQNEIDNFEVDINFEKQNVKLSDIPSITIPHIELLDDFIEFTPE